MKKLLSLTILALLISISSFATPGPIAGPTSVCVGSGINLSDSLYPGGVWTSSNTAIATVGSLDGYVFGVSAGVVTITYTLSGYVTSSITVNPVPAPITGPTHVCVGSVITHADATPGGTWTSWNPAIESIGSLTGIGTGVSAGTNYVYYTIPGTGCNVYIMDTVNGTPVDSIVGLSSVCLGSTITLTDGTTGGTWSSSAPSVATVSGGGVVTGISLGTVDISYTVTGACGPYSRIKPVTVTTSTSAGTISGATTVVAGSNTTLTDGVGGGTWTSSNTAVATVNPSTGLVTGVAAGSCTISYTVTGGCGTAYATAPMTVTALLVNRISGNVNFSGVAIDSTNPIKVWLITYNPITLLLEAVDSVTLYSGGTSVYYQFMGAVTDSYRVKAAYFPATFTGTGYIPTYHTSQFYWHDANVIWHTSGTADDGEDINMAYGTVTAGPGFIAGDVTTGADKGTAGGAPAAGLLIYARNTSGTIIQQAYTDGTGHYTFSNLPVGSYTVYPEAINYNTTPYPTITLTTGTPGMSIASFIQHTVSHRITPVVAGIHNVTAGSSSIVAFPNPTSGKLNIQWNVNATEKGTVTIADITGRQIYTSTINMNQGTGTFQADLSALTNGLYMISVKSATINYNNKIQVQH